MSGMDEFLIGAFFREKPRTKLPWEYPNGKRKTENKAGKIASETKAVKEKAWNDWSSETTLLKDRSRQHNSSQDDRSIVSKELEDELLTKITSGEISINEIGNKYGRKRKAERIPPVDDGKIQDFDFEDTLTRGNKLSKSTLPYDVSNRPSFLRETHSFSAQPTNKTILLRGTSPFSDKLTGKPSFLRDTHSCSAQQTNKPMLLRDTSSFSDKLTGKPSFLESKQSGFNISPRHRPDVGDNPNKIVDAGFTELPKVPKPRRSKMPSCNKIVDIGLGPPGPGPVMSKCAQAPWL